MKFNNIYTRILLTILLIAFTLPLMAQEVNNSKQDKFTIEQGTILTGFSVSGITASRDDYNHEFEKAFKRLRLNFEGSYFLSKHFAIGPTLGYDYVYRDFEDPSDFFSPPDQWQWGFLYGAQVSGYIPTEQLLISDIFQNTYLFLKGDINWLWNHQKTEGLESDPTNQIGYQVKTGLLLPVGSNISIELDLGWETRRQKYEYVSFGNNQQQINETTKWQKELSVALGFKLIF